MKLNNFSNKDFYIVLINQSNNTGNPLIIEITVTDITPAN